MPSEPKTEQDPIQTALRGPAEHFHSALAATIEQVRRSLASARPADDGPASPRAAELGKFAEGRIAIDRFAALLSETRRVDSSTADIMERALLVLSELARRDEELCRVTVGPGQSLSGAVSAALAEVGRAFGATRVYELARSGRFQESQHGRWLLSFPHGRWTEAERRMAPPLVVTLNGADLRAPALAEFLDGRQKIVLVVRGGAPVAPLVPLVSPGIYVLQTTDLADLEAFAAHPGPGIAAVIAEDAACFRHDPAGGARSWQRLTVVSVPATRARKAVGPISPAQQQETLRQLDELARAPAVVTAAATTSAAGPAGPTSPTEPASPAGSPAKKLAAWLLQQSDLSGLD